VAAYGNLVNRVLTFVYKNFEGKVPEPSELQADDKALLKVVDTAIDEAGEQLAGCHFRAAVQTAMAAAREANRYLDDKAPWKAIKTDRAAAATSLYTVINVISGLKTVFYPFLPFSSRKVHEYLGFSSSVEASGWKRQEVPAGQALQKPAPLFTKLDESIIDEETSRIGT